MTKKVLIILVLLISIALGSVPTKDSKIHLRTITPKVSSGEKFIGDHIFYSFEFRNAPFAPSFSISFTDPSGNHPPVDRHEYPKQGKAEPRLSSKASYVAELACWS